MTDTKKPYDPKLREAALEFEQLCKRYDCVGVALFVSKTHSEFINYLSPTWSVMKLEPPNGLRFRSKKEDFKSKEEQHENTNATAHALTSIVEWSRQINDVTRSILQQISKHMAVVWSTWDKPDSTPGDGK